MGYVKALPGSTRLALEMALHEEQERRALEGELWILEQAWKEAEEIAAIADNLLLPVGTEAFLRPTRLERQFGSPSPSGSPDHGDASSSPSAVPSCRNAKHLK